MFRRTAGKPVPHDSFRKDLYRQPSLTQQELYPEPYRRDSSYEHLRQSPSEEDLEAAASAAAATAADDDVALLRSTQQQHRPRGRGSRGTMSINVHEELDQGEDCQAVLKVDLSRGCTHIQRLHSRFKYVPVYLYLLAYDMYLMSINDRPISRRWCCRWLERSRFPSRFCVADTVSASNSPPTTTTMPPMQHQPLSQDSDRDPMMG